MIDFLEHRRLYAFAANVNFQPGNAAIPSGYTADSGLVYGTRTSSLSFGWNVDNKANAKDRNASNAPDQRYDTLNYLKRGTAYTWQIAVPNGTYSVRLVAGDPLQSGARSIINVEGKTAVDVTYSSSVRWADKTISVAVTDGKLTITPGASSGDAKLCFVEIKEVATNPPTPPPPPATTQTLQAESAALSGGTVKATNHTGYTGTGFADYAGQNSAVEWSLNWAAAGNAKLDFRYANGSTTDRPLTIYVNGVSIGTIACAPTANWATWATVSLTTALKAGGNTIKAVAGTSIGGANVDALTATATTVTPPEPTTQTLQAETAALTGGTVKATNHTGYTGAGFADYAGQNSAVEWTLNWASAGNARLDLRYANGSTTDRPLTIYVNGVSVGTIACAPTASWDTWTTVSLTTPLKAGVNTIKAIASSAVGGANVDSLTVLPTTVTPPVYDAELMNAIPGVFATAQTSVNRSLADIGNSSAKYPNLTKPDGTWEIIDHTKWTSGFWPGVMWQLYDYTKNSTWLNNATKWTTPLATQTQKEGDLAFRFMTTYLPLYEQSKSAADRDVLLKAAAAKNAMWNETVGAFQTTWYYSHSGNPKANFAVLMDMTTDLELMMWAGKETGNQQYVDRAVKHFTLVSKYLVASDGGTRHFALFDKATGLFQGNETYQGYDDNSTWGRGQGWAIYSFANMARDTGRADFLSAARKVADFYLANMPADGVTYWDFNDPKIPGTFRDSSAAAVAADGMLQIAKLITDPATSAKYRQGAEKILKSLINNYLIKNPTTATQRGLLQHGALDVPHRPEANDVTLIFGDYYFLHALNRYRTFA